VVDFFWKGEILGLGQFVCSGLAVLPHSTNLHGISHMGESDKLFAPVMNGSIGPSFLIPTQFE